MSDRYTNRELSWLQFNDRILAEAERKEVPLFERVRFAAIVASNLDEFFRVRIGKLLRRIAAQPNTADVSGYTPTALLPEICRRVSEQEKALQLLLTDSLIPGLAQAGLVLRKAEALSGELLTAVRACMQEMIAACGQPELLPADVEAAARITDGDVCLLLNENGTKKLLLPPKGAPLAYQLMTDERGCVHAVVLEEMLRCWAAENTAATVETAFRVTRDACFDVTDTSKEKLLKTIRKGLESQKTGAVTRIEYRGAKPEYPACVTGAVIETAETVSVKAVAAALDFADRPECNYSPYTARECFKGEKLFRQIRKHDRFMFHPYDSFEPVIRLLQEAAEDSKTVSIKQTLYRVSKDSPVAHALMKAAANGKQVTVLMEAKARFDEAANLGWGKKFEDAGCLVIYGVPGVKIHSKITLIVRRENGKTVRYCHLGTGNYHDKTARVYTDMGILTANSDIGQDAAAYFNLVEGYREVRGMKRLIAAPRKLRKSLTHLIRRETEAARAGKPCGIEAKMNALTDRGMIDALYEASQAGVPIRLVVRGICCLKPGVEGLSENITVHSVVGRYLEHARVYRFCAGGKWETYLASADMMTRNLDRRMELMFPVLDADVREKVAQIFDLQYRDNEQAWRLTGENWQPIRDGRCPDEPVISSQNEMMKEETAKNAI